MKFKVIIIFIFFVNSIYSQNNLLHNAGFETAENNQTNAPCRHGVADLLDDWETDAFYPGTCNYQNCNGNYNCNCQPCQTFSSPGFHTTDWMKVIMTNNPNFCTQTFCWLKEETNIPDNLNQGSFIYRPITGRNGSESYIGMSKFELIQQKFYNSNPIVGGKTYVFSAYVRIPKKPTIFRANSNPGNSCGSSIAGNPNALIQYQSPQEMSLDIYLSSSKIKYLNNTFLLCGSDGSDGFKQTSNNIVKLNTFDLNSNIQNYYNWHRISFEFVCPSNHNYDWFTMEISNSNFNTPYLIIDDVSIVEKCELECTTTSGIPNPLIASAVSNNCAQGQVSNIQNVSDLKIEIFTLHGQLIRVQQFYSINGFATPRYWDGNTQALSPVAPAEYILKATCTNACGTFTFAEQIIHSCPFASNPPDILAEEEFKPCCEINHFFNNKTFGSVSGLPYQYFYHPKSGIYVNDCSFTTGGATTLKAGKEIVFSGETQITSHPLVNFQAIIEECSDAHRLANTILTDKDFIFYESTGIEDNKNDIPKLNNNNLLHNTFKIIPNPNNGKFKIMFDKNTSFPEKVIINDLLGKEVFVVLSPNVYEFEIDLLHLNAGIYFVNIYFNNVIQSQKVVKQ